MSELVDRSGYFAGPGMLGGSFEDAARAVDAAERGADGLPAGSDGAPVAPAPEQVVFYELTRKFVETKEDVPEDSKNVLYYTLAVGHHTGVMDCFEPKVGCPLTVLDHVIEDMHECEGRQKLSCLREFGEIQIDKENAPALLDAVSAVREALGYKGSAKAGIDFLDPDFGRHTQEIAFLSRLHELLERVIEVSGVYVMGRLQ